MTSSMSGGMGATGSKIPKGYAAGKLQQFSPEQMGLFKQLFGYTSPEGQLAKQAGGDLSGFAPQEALAQRQFQEFQGQNASRFSGLGMGSRRGSGFQNSQTQGAQDFALQLASQRQGLQRQALMDLMGISQSLLGQRPQEQFLVKKDLPFWQQAALGAAGGLGQGLSGGLGGLFGAFGGGKQQPQQAQFTQTQYQ